MPAKRAFRESWGAQRLANALLAEQAQAAISMARRSGKRLAGYLALRCGSPQEARLAVRDVANSWLSLNGVWAVLWPLATRIAIARLTTSDVSIPHGGTVLPAQKRQYHVDS